MSSSPNLGSTSPSSTSTQDTDFPLISVIDNNLTDIIGTSQVAIDVLSQDATKQSMLEVNKKKVNNSNTLW